jgi:hypothetical protein
VSTWQRNSARERTKCPTITEKWLPTRQPSYSLSSDRLSSAVLDGPSTPLILAKQPLACATTWQRRWRPSACDATTEPSSNCPICRYTRAPEEERAVVITGTYASLLKSPSSQPSGSGNASITLPAEKAGVMLNCSLRPPLKWKTTLNGVGAGPLALVAP